MPEKKNRIDAIDYIRGISMMGVVGIHVGSIFVQNSAVNVYTLAALEIATRFSIPIFFFIISFLYHIIYAFLLLYFINLNNVPMSTTWVFIGLLAGREVALYQRLRFESPKKMYKHILKDLYKVTLGLVVSIAVVILLTQFDKVTHFFFSHFIGG